nr:NAD(P)-dependent oxidoreductase [Candidatus Sigynarchaeota archaeon]
MNLKIGFVGLGIMGESMCENVIKHGFDTWIYDVDKSKMDKIALKGGKPVKFIQEMTDLVDIIIIMVPNNEHVQDVIEKLLPTLKPRTIIIDMSTISPDVSKALAMQVKATGCTMLDAPVVKSKAAAITGTLGIYVGGDRDAFVRVIPVLQTMGENIIHLGPNGAGLVMKLCHNALVAGIQNDVNEVITLAKAAGCHDIGIFARCMSYGGAQNFYLDAKAKSLTENDFSPKFPFEHMYKDLSLVSKFSKDLGLEMPGIQHSFKIYKDGTEQGLGKEDFSASIKIVEKNAKK